MTVAPHHPIGLPDSRPTPSPPGKALRISKGVSSILFISPVSAACFTAIEVERPCGVNPNNRWRTADTSSLSLSITPDLRVPANLQIFGSLNYRTTQGMYPLLALFGKGQTEIVQVYCQEYSYSKNTYVPFSSVLRDNWSRGSYETKVLQEEWKDWSPRANQKMSLSLKDITQLWQLVRPCRRHWSPARDRQQRWWAGPHLDQDCLVIMPVPLLKPKPWCQGPVDGRRGPWSPLFFFLIWLCCMHLLSLLFGIICFFVPIVRENSTIEVRKHSRALMPTHFLQMILLNFILPLSPI